MMSVYTWLCGVGASCLPSASDKIFARNIRLINAPLSSLYIIVLQGTPVCCFDAREPHHTCKAIANLKIDNRIDSGPSFMVSETSHPTAWQARCDDCNRFITVATRKRRWTNEFRLRANSAHKEVKKMKRTLMVAVIAMVSPAMALAAAPPLPGLAKQCLLQPAAAELILNVSRLPAKVELSLGQNVVIVSTTSNSASKLAVGHRFNKPMAGSADPLERMNTATVIRKGYRVVAVFQAKSEGNGELTVTVDGVGNRVPFLVQGVAAPTGIEGSVVSGPHRPVSRPGDPDSGSPVAGAVIVVEDSTGIEVARTTTDANGNYKVVVGPGSYTVTARLPKEKVHLPGSFSREITVPRHGYEKLNIKLDTGIRKVEKEKPASEFDSRIKFRNDRSI